MDKDKRKLLSVLSHASILFSSSLVSFLVPIVILLATEDKIVKRNAKEALNFYLNLYIIFGVIFGILFFGLIFSGTIILERYYISIGIFLIIGLGIVNFVFPLVGMVKTAIDPNKVYRYPAVFRFF